MSFANLFRRAIRPWVRFLFESGSRDSKNLFVEQLEDRCFLSAVAMNDGGVAPVDPVSDQQSEETEMDSPSTDSDQPRDEENPNGGVENISPLELPSWAKEQIVESSGEFVEAFRLGEQGGTVVHFRDGFGDSKVLYRDAATVREVSLTDVIVNQLERVGLVDQLIREIDDLDVELRTRQDSEQVRLEGLATLESPDGTTRLIGFTLQFESSAVAQQTFPGGLPNLVPPRFPDGSAGSAHTNEVAIDNPRIETVGPQLPSDLVDPFNGFEDQFSVDFWLPDSGFLLDGTDLKTIPPQELLPDPSLLDSTRQEPIWQGGQDATTVDDFFSEPNLIQPSDEVIEELVPQDDLLKSVLDEPLEEDILHDELMHDSLDSRPSDQSFDAIPDETPRRNEEEAPPKHEVNTGRHAWPNELSWFDEDDETSEDKRDRGSAHASDVNAFNIPRVGATSKESDSGEREAAEARLPKSSGQTRQEP